MKWSIQSPTRTFTVMVSIMMVAIGVWLLPRPGANAFRSWLRKQSAYFLPPVEKGQFILFSAGTRRFAISPTKADGANERLEATLLDESGSHSIILKGSFATFYGYIVNWWYTGHDSIAIWCAPPQAWPATIKTFQ